MVKRVAVMLVAVLALAACGSSGSTTLPGGTNGSSNTTGSGGSADDFSTLIAKSKSAVYKATYSTDNDTQFTVAQDPPKFSFVGGDVATYTTAEGNTVTCNGTGSDASCTQISGIGNAVSQGLSSVFGSVGAALIAAAGSGIPGLSHLTDTSSQTIAGRDATCATVDAKSLGVLGSALGDASFSACIDKETGVLLSTKTTGGGKTSEVKATEFGKPTDSDFTPPATPLTLPGSTPTT